MSAVIVRSTVFVAFIAFVSVCLFFSVFFESANIVEVQTARVPLEDALLKHSFLMLQPYLYGKPRLGQGWIIN